MQKAILLCAGLWLGIVSVSEAQIILTSADMPTAGEVFTSDQIEPDYNDSVDIGATGTGQTWDFSNLPTIGEPQSIYYLDPAQTPHSGIFPTATLSSTSEISDTADYNYLQLSNTAYLQLGDFSTTVLDGDTKASFDPPLQVLKFPFAYQTSFTQSGDIDGESAGQTASGTYTSSVVADASGMVTTALGTFPALRVKRITELTLYISFFVITQTDTTYEWWTKQYSAPVFTYNRNATDFFGSIEYGVYATALTGQTVPTQEPITARPVALTVTPNPMPATAELSFNLSAGGQAVVSVVDMHGKVVAENPLGMLTPGTYRQPLDLSKQSPGAYVALLRQNGRIVGFKEVVRN